MSATIFNLVPPNEEPTKAAPTEPTPEPPAEEGTLARVQKMDRNQLTQAMRTALQKRSGKHWSVKGGRGTAYGWLDIKAKPNEYMTPEEQSELARLLGLEFVPRRGVSVAASTAYYVEYLDRCEGRPPSMIGKPYWD